MSRADVVVRVGYVISVPVEQAIVHVRVITTTIDEQQPTESCPYMPYDCLPLSRQDITLLFDTKFFSKPNVMVSFL